MRVPSLSRAARLPGKEWITGGTVLLMVPVFHILVRAAGFARVTRHLDRPRAAAPPADPDDAISGCVLALNRVKAYSPVPGNCLSQSLALFWLLRRRGFAPALRLGARHAPGPFEAHAWVELDGHVLNDTADVAERFAPLRQSPAAVTTSVPGHD